MSKATQTYSFFRASFILHSLLFSSDFSSDFLLFLSIYLNVSPAPGEITLLHFLARKLKHWKTAFLGCKRDGFLKSEEKVSNYYLQLRG